MNAQKEAEERNTLLGRKLQILSSVSCNKVVILLQKRMKRMKYGSLLLKMTDLSEAGHKVYANFLRRLI